MSSTWVMILIPLVPNLSDLPLFFLAFRCYTFWVAWPNPTHFLGLTWPNFQVQTGRVGWPSGSKNGSNLNPTRKVGPQGSKSGWVGLALRVKLRIKFGSGWLSSFGRTNFELKLWNFLDFRSWIRILRSFQDQKSQIHSYTSTQKVNYLRPKL